MLCVVNIARLQAMYVVKTQVHNEPAAAGQPQV